MKTVVITGSARGLGFEMAKVFRKNNFNVMISDLDEENLKKAKEELESITSNSKVAYTKCNVTNKEDIKNLVDNTKKEFKEIDIWVNNAGVNQPDKAIWELDDSAIDLIVDVDLKGTIFCSKYIMQEMERQKHGAIYNVEGYGSNDAKMLGLSIYGTAKRGVTYFTEALAKECETKNNSIIVGKLSPGIMITDFITNALKDKEKIKLSDKTKKVYNILGDYPETIAKYMVPKIIDNKDSNVKFTWLTKSRALARFIKATFGIKHDFFKDK